jgi:hypothetical protein
MRWRYAATGMVALMMMTGCPHDYGKDGRADKEAHKAALGLVRKRDCDWKTYMDICYGRENTPECIETCG